MPTHRFGLHGGLGNCIFTLPTIKALSRRGPVELYVQGDYPMLNLFARCKYASIVRSYKHAQVGTVGWCGQYPPSPVPGVKWRRLGWPPRQQVYPHAEWEQIKLRAVDNMAPEIVRDWVAGLSRSPERRIGLIFGGKPGDEWARKRYPLAAKVPDALRESFPGYELEAFGLESDIKEEHLTACWTGEISLGELPEALARCQVVVGTDNGVMHLAASIGVPAVIIYTATCPTKGKPVADPDRFRQLWRGLSCAPCQSTARWRACKNWECQAIPLDSIVRSVAEMVDRFPLPEEEDEVVIG